MRFASIALALGVVLSLPIRSEAALIPTEWVTPVSTVIDFNSAPIGPLSTLVVGDFTFTWVGFADQPRISPVGTGNNALNDPENAGFGAGLIMSLTSGGPFTVTQFDIVATGAGRIDFGGVSYLLPVSQTVTRSDLSDIIGLAINVVDAGVALDNIHVIYDAAWVPPPTPTAVPEPATLSLVGLGALVVASRLRRRGQRSS